MNTEPPAATIGSGSAAWLDEADRALGDCLNRIEHIAPGALPPPDLRSELLFLLRAARADLATRYVAVTYTPSNELGESVTGE
jgi:hypothetical protein